MRKDDKPAIVKKYANRRLYNTQTSVYVTLEDLCQMVKRGEDFLVQDAKSGEDLTRSVLTQIIFEQESKGYNVLPITFLRRLIGFYDDSLSLLLPAYLESVMETFSRNQEQMRRYLGGDLMGKVLGEFSPIAQFEKLSRQNADFFQQTMDMMTQLNPMNFLPDEKQGKR